MTTKNKLLFDILKASLWGGRIDQPIPDAVLLELKAQTVDGLVLAAMHTTDSIKYLWVAQFVQMAAVQTEALRVLEKAQIPAVVIKGTASGKNYPVPYLRRYGDIDILVRPENYQKAIDVLKQQCYVQKGDIGKDETHLYKNSQLIELHQSPPGLERVIEGPYILNYLLSGLDDIQKEEISQPRCVFQALPWKQHGLELIWHIREHLYNGLGLRHIIDWMMFVNSKLHTNDEYEEFRPILEKAGLLMLAKSVTRMCQMYLGLDRAISWCMDTDEAVCVDLMDYILEQGNFGHKKGDDKAAKVMTRYRTSLSFLKGMQKKGLNEWSVIRKHPILRPFAWIYSLLQGSKKYLRRGGIKQLREDRAENMRRRKLFDQLYSEKHGVQ